MYYILFLDLFLFKILSCSFQNLISNHLTININRLHQWFKYRFCGFNSRLSRLDLDRSESLFTKKKKVPRSDLVQNRCDFVENPSIKCGFLVESISRFLRFCQVYKDWTRFISCHSFKYHSNKFNFWCKIKKKIY